MTNELEKIYTIIDLLYTDREANKILKSYVLLDYKNYIRDEERRKNNPHKISIVRSELEGVKIGSAAQPTYEQKLRNMAFHEYINMSDEDVNALKSFNSLKPFWCRCL